MYSAIASIAAVRYVRRAMHLSLTAVRISYIQAVGEAMQKNICLILHKRRRTPPFEIYYFVDRDLKKAKKKIPDAEVFSEKAARYFAECDSARMPCTSCKKGKEDESACDSCGKKRSRPYTLSGLCLSLGISRKEFDALKNDKAFCEAVEMAMLKIEAYIEENCMSGNTSGTFALAVLREYFGFGKEAEENEISVTLSSETEKLAR